MSTERIDWPEIHRRLAASQEALTRDARLTGDVADAILKTRAESLARENGADSSAKEMLDIVAFMLGQERYGVESRYVREVYPLIELVTLPGTPLFVLGIVNIRGQVLSVIDLGMLFDLPPRGVGEYDRIIVLHNDEMEFGLLGTAILGLTRIPRDALQQSLPTLTGIREKFLLGVTRDRMAVLNAEQLLSDSSMVVHEEA
jgi:purine-binding chemotaxis protein CheW